MTAATKSHRNTRKAPPKTMTWQPRPEDRQRMQEVQTRFGLTTDSEAIRFALKQVLNLNLAKEANA
jgi:hypothetical protein